METIYRQLTSEEISQLQLNGNTAEDWTQILVSDNFLCKYLRNNDFTGVVKLGPISEEWKQDGALCLPIGIYNSRISSCIFGANFAIHNVHYMSNYFIGDDVLIFNVDEMTVCAEQLEYIEPMNECGGRRILPYNGMLIADAYLWAKYRDHELLMNQLDLFTHHSLLQDKGRVGVVGDSCVIKNCRTIHNIAINSSKEDPSRLVDCVVVSNGVVGYGCHLEYGCIALRFLLGEHVKLERGVRLTDTVVGDNSTIACCEVGNNIIFPAHEQHHNNSFLIASLIKGQSNVAAGATIGSNHNGRTADNEIVAGRGFWPGLCSSFKHSSRFASYCLLSKAAYPNELDIKLPFSLVNNNVSKDCLEVMPAYWWMYNMYALDRNSRKFAARDKRIYAQQHIEFNTLAPDTVEEILQARQLLTKWISNAQDGVVFGEGLEKGSRKTVILKPHKALQAYEDMLVYYAMQVLTNNGETKALPQCRNNKRESQWINLGGQLIGGNDFAQMLSDIEQGKLVSWQDIHNRYNQLWQEYPSAKYSHAYSVLCLLLKVDRVNNNDWDNLLTQYERICQYVTEQVKLTRNKDKENSYRQMTYDNLAEMQAVLG